MFNLNNNLKLIYLLYFIIFNQFCFSQIENQSNIEWKVELIQKNKYIYVLKLMGFPKNGSSFTVENVKSKNIINGLLFAGFENKRNPKGFMKSKERNFVMIKLPYIVSHNLSEKLNYLSEPFEIQFEIKKIKSNKSIIWENQIHFLVNKINGFSTEYICYGFKIDKTNECYIKSFLVYEGCDAIWR